MLTVTDLAKASGTTAHAVRYYTRLGLLKPERNPDNGYRLYQTREVPWLRFIQQAKRLGYTLNDIQGIMQDADRGESPCPRVREILQSRIEENRRQLDAQVALQVRMEQALRQWEAMPDGIPDWHSVCHLIESFATADQGSTLEQ